jgi:predicted enzyme related to lactoylglutathione lyase
VTAPEGSPGHRARARTEREPGVEELSGIVARAGIPITSFFSSDLDADYKRLVGDGVPFTKELTDMPWGKFAILDDTCGNLIQLQQVNFTG